MNDIVSVGVGLLSNILSSDTYQKIQDCEFKNKIKKIAESIDEIVDSIADPVHRDYIQCKLLNYLDFNNDIYEKDQEYKIEKFIRDAPIFINKEEKEKIADCFSIINSGLQESISKENVVILNELKSLKLELLEALKKKNDDSINSNSEKIKNNQKEDYLKVWKSVLFLNRGEANSKDLTLENIYVVPEYQEYTYSNGKSEMLDGEAPLETVIYNFINNENRKGLIVYGSPGIGKSSLVNYNAGKENNFNIHGKKFIYIGMQYLDIDEIQDKSLLAAIVKFLECTEKDLTNSICILDGLDEIQSEVNLNEIIGKFLLVIPKYNMKAIITSRDNIIKYSDLGNRVTILKLKPFSSENIEKFNTNYKKYQDISFDPNEVKGKNLDVLGIPLMLYFVHALNLKMSDTQDKCRLYDKVFSGIYDKCRIEYLDVKDNITKESNYGMPLISGVSEQMKIDFDKIAKLIAYETFKSDRELQDVKKIKNLLAMRDDIDEMSKKRYPISNFYNTNKNYIKFVHRSFYEYFMAQYLYSIISENIDSVDKMVNNLIPVIKENYINDEIKSFLIYKLEGSNKKYKKSACYTQMEKTTNKILKNCEKSYKDIEKSHIFYNILCIFGIFHQINGQGNYKQIYKTNPSLFITLLSVYQIYKGNECGNLDLRYLNFSKGNLYGVDFSDSDMSNCLFNDAGLNYAQVNYCNIFNAQFSRSYLNMAAFMGSHIKSVKFNHCNLFFTNFLETQLDCCEFNESEPPIVLLLDNNNYKDVDCYLGDSYIWHDFRMIEKYSDKIDKQE